MGKGGSKSRMRLREGYDPTRGLTPERVRSMVTGVSRGEYADLMWLLAAPYMGVESLDADMLALCERRTSALAEMDWRVLKLDPKTEGFDATLAAEQESALKEAYERLADVPALVSHFAMSAFRGVALAERSLANDGTLDSITLVNPWNIARVGLDGDWVWNPEAKNVSGDFLPKENRFDPRLLMVRTTTRPLASIAVHKFVRDALCDRDWDSFTEIYGVPGGVVTMPQNIPNGEEDAYRTAAEEIAKGGSGTLPNGSTYFANTGPRGSSPFRERIEHLQRKLILAGTGGQLTMLTASTGMNSGQADAHTGVFRQIARKDAREIGSLFQDAVDRLVLDKAFQGRPRLAYWTLALNEEPDADAGIERLTKLSGAGYKVAPSVVKEISGYEVTVESEKPAPGAEPSRFANRETATTDAEGGTPSAKFLAAVAGRAAPVLDLVEAVPDPAKDPEGFRRAMEELRERLPELMDPKAIGDALAEAMGKAAE